MEQISGTTGEQMLMRKLRKVEMAHILDSMTGIDGIIKWSERDDMRCPDCRRIGKKLKQVLAMTNTITVSKADKKAILCLLYHVRRDLSYGYEGSFVNSKGDDVNKREYKMAKRAHDLLYKVVSGL